MFGALAAASQPRLAVSGDELVEGRGAGAAGGAGEAGGPAEGVEEGGAGTGAGPTDAMPPAPPTGSVEQGD